MLGEPARYARLYYISLSRRTLLDFVNSYAPAIRQGAVFHEALHYTGANNRGDHNEIESVLYGAPNACANNALDDRIVMLQAVCGFSGQAARGDVLDRIARCGTRRGCMSTLMTVQPDAHMSWSDPHMYGAPMAEGDARLFCRDLQGEAVAGQLERRRREEAQERAALVQRLVNAAASELLLSDHPTPAPRYLFPLSAADRRRLAAQPDLALLGKLCVAQVGGTIDAAAQPRECPLSRASSDPALALLVEFNNREARLVESLRLRAANLWAASMKSLGDAHLARLGAEIDQLFADNCPTGERDFVPRVCEAQVPLRDALASVRRAAE
jgi:hypothetical protein